MYVGVDMIRASQVRKQEKRLHTETLEELSASFDDDIEPMVVEIQGTQHRLTGTADAQYDEWRGLLRQMFITESGFVPEDVAIYTEPEPEPEAPSSCRWCRNRRSRPRRWSKRRPIRPTRPRRKPPMRALAPATEFEGARSARSLTPIPRLPTAATGGVQSRCAAAAARPRFGTRLRPMGVRPL